MNGTRRPRLTLVPAPDPLATPRRRLAHLRVGGAPIEPVQPRERKESALETKRISKETFGRVLAAHLVGAEPESALT